VKAQLILLMAAVGLSGAAVSEPPAWVDRAREAAGRLGKELKAELTSALSESGPSGGVRVCRDRAPEIAAAVSGDGLRVGRTAPRVRNPDNAPDDWERDVLADFRTRIDAGADPAELEQWAVRETAGGRTGRWMKAIPMQPQCALCHGRDIPPELAETIGSLYPEDRATGFEVGDLRGAFTVSVDLPTADADRSD
jgi:hypothetical protein